MSGGYRCASPAPRKVPEKQQKYNLKSKVQIYSKTCHRTKEKKMAAFVLTKKKT